jgi:hypothetical protein
MNEPLPQTTFLKLEKLSWKVTSLRAELGYGVAKGVRMYFYFRNIVVSRSQLRKLSSSPSVSTMSLSLVSNAYLEETAAKIRTKPVPWEVSSFHLVH